MPFYKTLPSLHPSLRRFIAFKRG